MFFAFGEGHAKRTLVEDRYLALFCHIAFYIYSALHTFLKTGGEISLGRDLVFFFMHEFRIEEAVGNARVVGEDEKTT